MNKVICDICGTSYPENEQQCPICGYAPGFQVEPLADDEDFVLDDILLENAENAETAEVAEEAPVEETAEQEETVAAVPVAAEEATEPEADENAEAEAQEEVKEEGGKRRPSGFLIGALVVVILALLATTGYIFARYYLPGMRSEATEAPTVETTVATEDTAPTTVPCTGLAMTSDSEVLLEQAGNTWLINVVVLPENTTDEIIYLSNNLDVATVDADGTVTAVGEGSAVISVVCGEYTVACNVTCAFVEEPSVPDEIGTVPSEEETEVSEGDETVAPDEQATEAPTEAATESATETATEAATEVATDAATEEATEAPTEEATEAPTEAATEPVDGLVLTLNKSDISFDRVGVYYTLKVTEGIDPADVEWSSGNSAVCVVEDGVITITGAGMTTVKATYKGQEATCLVRVTKGK